MDNKPQIQDSHYNALVKQITELVAQSKQKALRAVNSALVEMNWNIGKYIVEFEQNGNARAEYGAKLIPQLSRDLTLRLGNGYSKSNLANMRLLYLRFPIFQALLGKLSWSHFMPPTAWMPICSSRNINYICQKLTN